jgi:hypothetical protein
MYPFSGGLDVGSELNQQGDTSGIRCRNTCRHDSAHPWGSDALGSRQAGADDEGMGTAIVVTLLVLLAVGLVTDQLLRLRRWLKKPPSSRT